MLLVLARSSHFVIRERSNIGTVKSPTTKRMLRHCEDYELTSLCVELCAFGCNSGLTGDIFKKPPKATPNKRESQSAVVSPAGPLEDALGHGVARTAMSSVGKDTED